MSRETIIVITIIVAVIAATLAYLVYINPWKTTSGEKNTVVVYTYNSLLAYGKERKALRDRLFHRFEEETGIKVKVIYFESTGELLARLENDAQAGKVEADVVIGLDNIQIIKAKQKGLLQPYTPDNINDIPSWLINSYDPEHYAIPYDYGIIALVYDTKYINPQTMENITFQDFQSNTTLAKTLVVEDPRLSSTGLSFLLYQIAVYKNILGEDWWTWWQNVKPYVAKSWDDAYDLFLKENYHIVVSYGTDPAYSYYFYNSTRYKATVLHVNGKPLAWLQIEGIGLVKGAPHPDAAKKFIQWFLSPEVQKEIPLNNWMYPANSKVKLPEAYSYAINPSSVEVVNSKLTQNDITANLDKWLDEWEDAVTG